MQAITGVDEKRFKSTKSGFTYREESVCMDTQKNADNGGISGGRIEFRAWTGKKMIYQDTQYLASFIRRAVTQIILDHEGTSIKHHESYLPNGGTIDEYLQQYIRVDDKNGKKAYIGDIVRLDKAIGLHGMRTFEIVELHALGFSLCREDIYEYDGINLQLIPFEIIGNVKENPELLKEGAGA
jgi:uncharacterized phage protein (TIGR01671 family)